ncbi:MAG: hypothetical protein IPP42_12485 [Saprospiraceae bacterium]|nr:hypothetical protein [Saprospiraceae bacterium]
MSKTNHLNYDQILAGIGSIIEELEGQQRYEEVKVLEAAAEKLLHAQSVEEYKFILKSALKVTVAVSKVTYIVDKILEVVNSSN